MCKEQLFLIPGHLHKTALKQSVSLQRPKNTNNISAHEGGHNDWKIYFEHFKYITYYSSHTKLCLQSAALFRCLLPSSRFTKKAHNNVKINNTMHCHTLNYISIRSFISAHQMVPWDSGNSKNRIFKYTVYFLFPMCQGFHQKRDLTLWWLSRSKCHRELPYCSKFLPLSSSKNDIPAFTIHYFIMPRDPTRSC